MRPLFTERVEPSRSGTYLPYKRLERSPSKKGTSALGRLIGSPGRTRTSDMLITGHPCVSARPGLSLHHLPVREFRWRALSLCTFP